MLTMKTSRYDKYHLIFLILGILTGSIISFTVINRGYNSQIQSLVNESKTKDNKIGELKIKITELNNSLIDITQKYNALETRRDVYSNPITVVLETSMGAIVLELYPESAPVSVENFVTYVEQGYFDGLVFHRVIQNFMIQGGGFLSNGTYREPTLDPIVCESNNGLYNSRGAIAMARSSQPNSATSQFFINVVDNPDLDYPSFDGYGYAVFGKVIDGINIVDNIANLETASKLTPYGTVDDWPIENVAIISAYIRD